MLMGYHIELVNSMIMFLMLMIILLIFVMIMIMIHFFVIMFVIMIILFMICAKVIYIIALIGLWFTLSYVFMLDIIKVMFVSLEVMKMGFMTKCFFDQVRSDYLLTVLIYMLSGLLINSFDFLVIVVIMILTMILMTIFMMIVILFMILWCIIRFELFEGLWDVSDSSLWVTLIKIFIFFLYRLIYVFFAL